jgi:hypothetical protein
MFPRRYYVDKNGHRVLIGLTVEETFEFETLDEIPPVADDGSIAWKSAEGMPTTEREIRWLELYTKHANAWTLWTLRRGNGVSTRIGS